jgi:hypothetical protein
MTSLTTPGSAQRDRPDELALFLHDVDVTLPAFPISGGASADVYRGSYRGSPVAIKVPRIFSCLSEADRKRREEVRHTVVTTCIVIV